VPAGSAGFDSYKKTATKAYPKLARASDFLPIVNAFRAKGSASLLQIVASLSQRGIPARATAGGIRIPCGEL
jgi:hypothetical protein